MRCHVVRGQGGADRLKTAEIALRAWAGAGHGEEYPSDALWPGLRRRLLRSGQPRTHSRECGIQPAHQSLITDVRLILPPAMRHQSAVLNPTFAAPDDRRVLLQEQKVSVELITATQDNGHRDATMVLAACRHGRGAGRLQNGYPARPEGQATHIWRPSNSLRRIARPTRRRCRQDYLKHGTSSGVRYTERSLEPVLKKLLALSATNPAGALRPWGSGSLSCGRRAAFGRQPGIGRAHQRNPQWSVQDAELLRS